MDSGELLDLLGNENRRRILRLLARKPCYVTEISECLEVSPKAVIDHLRRLESAGLVESRTDDRRRKYFHIARNLRLEVSLTPYGVGIKSAYPASADLDLARCHHLSVDVDHAPDGDGDTTALAEDLERLRELERELSLAQRWVQGRVADVRDSLTDAIDGAAEGDLHAEVLTALVDGPRSAAGIARRVEVPERAVRETLDTLVGQGLVEENGGEYRLA